MLWGLWLYSEIVELTSLFLRRSFTPAVYFGQLILHMTFRVLSTNQKHALLAVFIFLLGVASQVEAYAIAGRVVAISDGDTLIVLDSNNTQHKIRLSGIDAPEKDQPFGLASKKSLSDLVYGQNVVVNYDKRDRFGRTVGKIMASGQDINIEQIRRGLAWHYKKYMNEQPIEDRLSYTQAEELARADKVGLWADVGSLPPWEWRKQFH